MKTIRTIELSGSTRQERLPGFAEDFPYIASWAETGQYNGGTFAAAAWCMRPRRAPGRSVPAAAGWSMPMCCTAPATCRGPCGELDPPV